MPAAGKRPTRAGRWWLVGPVTIAAVIIATAAMLAATLLSSLAVRGQHQATTLADHEQDVLNAINRLTTASVDAETGQRGYLLTGSDDYLKPYYDAIINSHREIATLKQLEADDPRRMADIEAVGNLIEQHLQVLHESINARRLGQLTPALSLGNLGRGKAIQDRIRAELAIMIEEEREQLRSGQRDLEAGTITAARLVALGGVLAVIAVLAVAVASHLDARQRSFELTLAWENATAAQHHAEDLASQMQHAALHDSLTGLRNRRALDEDIEGEINRAHRHEHEITVASIDLDGLKAVNDSRGHAGGDELLRAFASELRARLRAEDRLYRMGGDEFAAILSHAGPAAFADVLARLQATAEAVRRLGFPEADASAGLASYPHEASSAGELLSLADRRMYEEKSRHRTRNERA